MKTTVNKIMLWNFLAFIFFILADDKIFFDLLTANKGTNKYLYTHSTSHLSNLTSHFSHLTSFWHDGCCSGDRLTTKP
jgi:hypothetical protein